MPQTRPVSSGNHCKAIQNNKNGELCWKGRPSSRAKAASVRAALASLISMVTVLTTVAAPPAVSFGPAAQFGVGSNPRSLAVDDFNNDGTLDLAAANFNSNNVSLLLGNGDGTFGAARNTAVGGNPIAVVAGDFNADGDLDLAALNFASNNISILLGGGTGFFAPARNFSSGTSAVALAAGDFDADGDVDLAVANFSVNAASVLLNNGDATFGSPRSFAVGTNPRSVAVGDFDGDGNLDLVAANDLSGNISVLLGNGDGTFDPARNFVVGPGSRPFSVAGGDFDGDDSPDLAVANALGGNVSILLGNGDGTFASPRNFSVAATLGFVGVGDFNKDDNLDLAVADSSSPSVFVLQGNGDGSFGAAMSFAAGGAVGSVASGDFNGDEKPDLALPIVGSNTVAVLLNTTVIVSPNQPPTATAGPNQIVGCSSPSGARVTLSGAGSDPDGDALTFEWTDENGNVVGGSASVQVLVPMGTHTFTLIVDDGHGHTASDTAQVTVGQTTGPVLSLALSPNTLWSPNHQLVEVTANIQVSDACEFNPEVALLAITSSEPDQGAGDGDKPNDIQGAALGTDDRLFSLRAERSGTGQGRVYTVRYRAVNSAGLEATAEAYVRVPHDPGQSAQNATSRRRR